MKGFLAPRVFSPSIINIILIIAISAIFLRASLALNPYATFQETFSKRPHRMAGSSSFRVLEAASLHFLILVFFGSRPFLSASQFNLLNTSNSLVSHSSPNLLFFDCPFRISSLSSYSSHLMDNPPGDCRPRTKDHAVAASRSRRPPC